MRTLPLCILIATTVALRASEFELDAVVRISDVGKAAEAGSALLNLRVVEGDPVGVLKTDQRLKVPVDLGQIEKFRLFPGTAHRVTLARGEQGAWRLSRHIEAIALELKDEPRGTEPGERPEPKPRKVPAPSASGSPQEDLEMAKALVALLGPDAKNLPPPEEILGRMAREATKDDEPFNLPEPVPDLPGARFAETTGPSVLQRARMWMVDDGAEQLVLYQGRLRRGTASLVPDQGISIEIAACDGRFAVVRGLAGVQIGGEVLVAQPASPAP